MKSNITQGPQYDELPRIAYTGADDLQRYIERQMPVVVTGILEKWPAYRKWSPEYFKAMWGNLPFSPTVDIPSGPEYVGPKKLWTDYQRDMTMAQFVDHLAFSDKPCYMHSQYLNKIAGAEDDVDLPNLMSDPEDNTDTFFWFGKNTHTGLHFDLRDNLLCQFYGRKTVNLISPSDSRYIARLRNSITKSPIDLPDPDIERYPKFARTTIYTGHIDPGEFLFVPNSWWHTVHSCGTAISVSHNFGKRTATRDLLWNIGVSGLPTILTVAKDFVWHGLLGREFEVRLFDDPPSGKFLYDLFTSAIQRRLPSMQTISE